MTATFPNRLNALRALAALTTLSLARLVFAESTMIGSVQDIPPGHIVVSVSTELMTFEVNSETSVTLDGQSVELSALRSGDRVRITTMPSEGSTVAARIVAERHSPARARAGT